MKMFRAVGIALFFVSSLAAQPYHPNIPKSQVVSLDAATIERHANSGTPFDLALGDTTLTIVLTPAPVFPEEGVTIVEIAKDGSAKESVVAAGNFTYAGEILGDDPATTEVRLTIAEGVLEGYVLSSQEWWFIEPLARFDPKAGKEDYLVYASRETDVAVDSGEDIENGDVLYDHPFIKDGKIPVVMVADLEYLYHSGSVMGVMQRHGTLINGVNGIFTMQFGRELKVPRVVIDLGAHLTSEDAATLLAQLKGLITLEKLVKLGGHIAHLTTGKDIDGNTHGRAEQPGYRSFSQQSTTLAFRNTVLAAHEIGHNFNSDHDEAEQYCTGSSPCLVYRQTLDARAFDRTTIARFSDGRLGPDHNNVDRICINLAGRQFPCQ